MPPSHSIHEEPQRGIIPVEPNKCKLRVFAPAFVCPIKMAHRSKCHVWGSTQEIIVLPKEIEESEVQQQNKDEDAFFGRITVKVDVSNKGGFDNRTSPKKMNVEEPLLDWGMREQLLDEGTCDNFESREESDMDFEGVDVSIDSMSEDLSNIDLTDYSNMEDGHLPSSTLQPRGLENKRNNCFANSVLQCLMHTTQLVVSDYFENIYDRYCPAEYWCFHCILRRYIINARQQTIPFYPAEVVDHLESFGGVFVEGVGPYYDSHEFLSQAIFQLESNLPKHKLRDTTNSIFDGFTMSQVHCNICDYKSKEFQSFRELALDVEDGDNQVIIKSLDDSLSYYTRDEQIVGLCCSKCCYGTLTKKTSIYQTPQVLILTLKRFRVFKGEVYKVQKKILFPLELNIDNFVSRDNSEQERKYELYAVVSHIGDKLDQGHYICYVKSRDWFYINDEEVRSVSQERVLNQEIGTSYIHLYSFHPTAKSG